ncbi:hypothetical protein MMC30_003145 [Trapelia coarctata]|nr:hypothetical protein [Trapelia coarctata]
MDASFPFPTLWHAQHGTCRLVDLLPNKIDLLSLLRAFEHHAPLGYFPYVPEECTERGVDRFLANVERHSLLHPDILALLFAALAQGVQSGLYGRCGGKWVPGAMHREVKKGDVFIAAAMHSLRIAAFLSRPTIPVVETLVMIGPYLINSGKYLDAWSLFGITVRLAQRIGLHQDPSQLNPPVSLAEVITRRKLWWWILHMDHHHSQAIGRPLAISSVGDCPSTSTLAHDAVVHGLEVYNARFTILARQTLTAGTLCNAQLDDYIHQLSSLPETLPDCLRFKEDWLDEGTLIPQWPIDVQAAFLYSQKHHLLAWLHRKRVDAISLESSDSTIDLFVSPASAPSNHTLYGREQVLESSRSILRVLGFFHTRERAAMICWTVGQQAFNAAWILLTSMLETRITMDVGILQQAYSIFVEMQSLGIHSLASGAVEKLRGLMDRCSTGATAGEFMVSSHAMILLEDPGSHIFGQGVVVPVACHGTSSPTPQTGQSNGGAAIAHGQKDLTVSIASSKKQKTTVNKSGARSKVTEKKSTVEQRRSSVPQRRYSGLWMKEERPAKPSLERNKNSSSQPPGLAHQGVQIVRPGSQGTNLRSSDTAGHSDIYGDATAFQSCRPFTSHNGPPYEHLGTTWTPFQMYTAAHTSAPPHERAIQMHRNYSNSYSEHSSDKPGNSQSSTQLSSPVQSHSFHGSPHSPQSQILPHDLYEHSFFGLTSVQAQAGTPALAPSVPSSYQVPDAPALTWQLSATGFHGDRQHLAPNSSL